MAKQVADYKPDPTAERKARERWMMQLRDVKSRYSCSAGKCEACLRTGHGSW
ncbi:MAG: hypothetical protein ACK5MN_03365 [Lachnospiraceae bacterium]